MAVTQDLNSLRIDRSLKSRPREPRRFWRWAIAGALLVLLLAAARAVYTYLNHETAVTVTRAVNAASDAAAGASGGNIVLNATGYIIAHHKIQVASKVVGKVAWIGVEKGDRVKQGQVIVRLEDDEYRAQLQQARGQLLSLEARLQELLNGSRPEEIAVAKANLAAAQADLANARVSLNRTRQLAEAKVLSAQALDDAQAKYDAFAARVASLERTYELVRIGPRQEVIDQVRGQIEQARGQVAFYDTQLANTVIRAPITGAILERIVEKGEFVTTSFVGEKGAKGFVVSMADLNDLQVELDINQNDFARLAPGQRGIVTADAFPDRKYQGFIEEISPEANRQKATVQVKVKVLNPDGYLRPEMNASVAFLATEKPGEAGAAPAAPVIYLPSAAVRGDAVFVFLNGRAVKKAVRVGGATPQGLRIEEGLIGGEDVIVNPPAGLRDGDKVKLQ